MKPAPYGSLGSVAGRVESGDFKFSLVGSGQGVSKSRGSVGGSRQTREVLTDPRTALLSTTTSGKRAFFNQNQGGTPNQQARTVFSCRIFELYVQAGIGLVEKGPIVKMQNCTLPTQSKIKIRQLPRQNVAAHRPRPKFKIKWQGEGHKGNAAEPVLATHHTCSSITRAHADTLATVTFDRQKHASKKIKQQLKNKKALRLPIFFQERVVLSKHQVGWRRGYHTSGNERTEEGIPRCCRGGGLKPWQRRASWGRPS